MKKSWLSNDLIKQVGLVIGTLGIIIGFWDRVSATYFVIVGMWLYLVLGDLK